MRRTRYIDTLGNPYQTGGGLVVAPDAMTSYADLERAIDEEMTALVAGRTGTAGTMELFSAHNHVAGTYTRNASLWCKDLVSQLTGCCVVAKWANVNWIEQRLGIMVTPRHLIQCNHAPIEYEYDGYPTMFRFIDASGTKVDRTALSQSDVTGTADHDITITLLNEAVPAGIHKIPVIVLDQETWYPILYTDPVYGGPCALGISQGTNGVNGQKTMAYTCLTNAVFSLNYVDPSDLVLSHIYYVISGDSGTPRTYLVNGALALCQLTGAGTVYDHADYIDARIAAADANAIALGTLAAPTGLTVTRYTPTIII